ncbi:hypothetical protein BU26DRAFT_609416 [Trematosphaeria pertusa]|uniref:Uncharacterized protein n=1 Tax=Trematosphaeria pertusa TaxID=390896 RepID=A0A6A6I052_9PLEO|nr:uncharacterized protein BU26DRAFT_609416 [Trematosphaeria pertusa]KAF2243352.1 hypothetical protein BU26DRAFT_609416 [Trematosphaeria pertusa]
MTAVDTHIAPHIPLPVLDSAQGAPSAGTTVTKVDSPVDSNPPKPATPAPTATPVATPQQHKPATANMAPVKPGKIHPRNHPNPTMTFPDRVEGFVDLETLTKIHSALCESQDPEDRQLASWVKEQYLWEPIENSAAGRPIQTREGFGKLETAYRRVRHLTNRAQDKWPFFDRNWKSMNAAMVRKVAMGELGMASPAPQAARGYQAVSRQNGFVAYHAAPEQLTTTPNNAVQPPTPTVIESVDASGASRGPTPASNMNGSFQGTPAPEAPQKAAASDTTNPALPTPPTPMESTSRATSESMGNFASAAMSTSASPDRPLIAADAEPVQTNLDALPSSSLKRKRGRERNGDGTFKPGPPKKPRGSRTGRGGGRGRKTRKSEAQVQSEDEANVTPSTFDVIMSENVDDNETPEIHTTRRSARLSGGEAPAQTERATSVAEAGSEAIEEENHGLLESALEASQAAPEKVDTAKATPARVTPATTAPARELSDEDFLRLGVAHTSGRHKTPATATPTPSMPATNDLSNGPPLAVLPTPVVPAVQTAPAATTAVEFVARFDSPKGVIEIPVTPSALTSDPTLLARIQRYANWKNGKGANVDLTFELFTSVFETM